MHLSIVTGNPWKYKQIVSGLPDVVVAEQVDLDLPEIQTNLLTDISADKAVQARAEVWGPVLVDDSGIYFDAYDEFPGALTKFLYSWVGIEGIQRLYTWETNMKATFQTVLSYMDDTLSEPLLFVWEITGTLDFSYISQADENPKLPYDLIFVPDGFTRPALYERDLWMSDNHRVRAVKKFGEWVSNKSR